MGCSTPAHTYSRRTLLNCWECLTKMDSWKIQLGMWIQIPMHFLKKQTRYRSIIVLFVAARRNCLKYKVGIILQSIIDFFLDSVLTYQHHIGWLFGASGPDHVDTNHMYYVFTSTPLLVWRMIFFLFTRYCRECMAKTGSKI